MKAQLEMLSHSSTSYPVTDTYFTFSISFPALPPFPFAIPRSSSYPAVSLSLLSFSLSISVWSLCCLPCLCPHLAPESMILLGSIERSQLQSLLSQQLGRARRLDYLRERAQDNGTHVPTFPQDSPSKTGRGVRFLV